MNAIHRSPASFWLNLARAAWVVLTLGAVGIFVGGTSSIFIGLQQSCLYFQPEFQSFCLQRQESLAQLGIPRGVYALYLSTGIVVEVLPWLVIGILVFWRKWDQLQGIFFSLALILLGTVAIDDSLFAWLLTTQPALAVLVNVIRFVGLSLVAMWYMFPDGEFVPRWTRWLAGLWVVRTFALIFLHDSWLNTDRLPAPLPDLTISFFIVSFAASLIYRYYRHATASQRQQIKWVVIGAIPYAVIYVTHFVLKLDATPSSVVTNLIYVAFLYLGSCLFALCLGFSILRSHLFDIDIIVRRTLAYAIGTLFLGIVFFGSIIVLQRLFSALTGSGQNELVTVLSTLGIAALFIPVRDRIQLVIDKRFNRSKYNAQQVLNDFATTVRDETNLEHLTTRLMEVVDETVQPASVSVWLKKNE